jgi:N utilization substance protein B
MGARSVAREAALMVLFGVEAPDDKGLSIDEQLAHFWRGVAGDAELDPDLESRTYAETIVRGVVAEKPALDAAIKKASANWRLERMSRVDRNVLRLGTWELAHDVPRAVAIDEAVELGKRFGTEDSGAFVNGVLERIATNLGKK